MKLRYLTSLFSVLFLMNACAADGDQTLDDYPNTHLLISASELNEKISSNEDFILIDTRGEVPDSLIPGAVHFAAVSELIDRDHPVEYYLIGPESFREKMRSLGLNNDDEVVLYDGGNALAAARLFYALDYYGFSNASVLNGGFQAWMEEDLPVSTSPVTPETGMFSVNVQDAKMCDIKYVMDASNDPDKIIFDARSTGEFDGSDERAEKSGHIPNAVNLEWSNVLESDGIPYFQPAEQIREKFIALGITPDKEVISHCHTNVRGSHAYFTLRLMGYDSVRTYEGSWAEYGNSAESVVE